MHISKITLSNFKSFKDTVHIDLTEKVNVILGKNGSGKSNLISAIQFVLCPEKLTLQERIDYIHEGTSISEEICTVALEIDNSDLRLHGDRIVFIQRSVSVKKDEFMYNNKVISREELKGLYDNAGLPANPTYFIVMQGRISFLSTLSDRERYSLVKDIAGASKYEKDRANCLELLDETSNTQIKIENTLERIESKLSGLEKERKQLQEYEELEKQKRRYEVEYSQREIVEINNEIRSLESRLVPESIDEESEEYEDIDHEIQNINRQLEVFYREASKVNARTENGVQKEDFLLKRDKIEEKIVLLSSTLESNNEKIKRMRKEEAQVFIDTNYIKYLLDFLKIFQNRTSDQDMEFINSEIANTKILLESKTKELKEKKVVQKNSVNISLNTLKELVEKRKQLWREEKKIEENNKGLVEMLNSSENKLLLAGCSSYKISKELSSEKGVLGCVFDLFEVENEVIDAFETVSSKYLFNIVVEDEEVATALLKNVKSNVTFIPLNRMFYEDPQEIEDENVFLLSSHIQCEKKYKKLLQYITKNCYVAADVKTAAHCSKKYNINVITLDGDMISNKGPMTGGYEKRSSVLKEHKRILSEFNGNRRKIESIKEKIANIGFEIEMIEKFYKEELPDDKQQECIQAIVRFLKEKIRILEEFKNSKKVSYNVTRVKEDLENKRNQYLCISSELKKNECVIKDLNEKLVKYKNMYVRIQNEIENNSFNDKPEYYNGKIKELKDKKDYLLNKKLSKENKQLFTMQGERNLENEKMMSRKHILYNKRSELCKKIGLVDYKNVESIFPNLSKQEILFKIKEYNDKLSRYCMINKRVVQQSESYLEQKKNLKQQLEDLKKNHKNISTFIKSLDDKKEETIEITMNMIKDNHKYFTKKLCNFGEVDLEQEEDLLMIKVNNERITLNSLSGGQKTMLALCLIFSIQKIDPSPLYVFDEMDANLDKASREIISNLLKDIADTEKTQIILTTFREELLSCGSSFVGVIFKEKKSYIETINKNIAVEFLSENIER